MKLKFNMLPHLTHINTIFEYYYASVILGNEDVLYLEDGNVYRLVLQNKTATMFFLKNIFLVITLNYKNSNQILHKHGTLLLET